MTVRRLEFDELSQEVAARLAPRVKRLGYLGEFFKCAAHQPTALAAFIDFTESGKGALPDRLVELIALTVATWMGNTYERNQHERLSVRLGFGREWVAAVEKLQPEANGGLTSQEGELQRLVLTILETKGREAPDLFAKTVKTLGEQSAIAVLMVVGRYVTHALFVNTLEIAPPVPSIFEDGFTG